MPKPQPSVVLLDVEGTTTPIDFVIKTLFPFARQRVEEFLRANSSAPEARADLALAWGEYQAQKPFATLPNWTDADSIDQAAAYLRWLIDQDVKSPALKSLQGKIWQQGYDSGQLHGEVYPDVPVALSRWKSEGRRVAIYSSGSVLAQKLLFRTTSHGDLTPHLEEHFDTAVGAKREAASYTRIAEKLQVSPESVIFVSDIVAELDAAKNAGMLTALSLRPGMLEPAPPVSHPIARDLNEALPPIR